MQTFENIRINLKLDIELLINSTLRRNLDKLDENVKNYIVDKKKEDLENIIRYILENCKFAIEKYIFENNIIDLELRLLAPSIYFNYITGKFYEKEYIAKHVEIYLYEYLEGSEKDDGGDIESVKIYWGKKLNNIIINEKEYDENKYELLLKIKDISINFNEKKIKMTKLENAKIHINLYLKMLVSEEEDSYVMNLDNLDSKVKKYIYDTKKDDIKKIVCKNIFGQYNILKYDLDYDNNNIYIMLDPIELYEPILKYNIEYDSNFISQSIKDELYDYIEDNWADTWGAADNVILESGEIDNNSYELQCYIRDVKITYNKNKKKHKQSGGKKFFKYIKKNNKSNTNYNLSTDKKHYIL